MERNDRPGASKLCNLTTKGNLDLNTTRSAIGSNNSRNQDRGLGEKQSHRPYSKNLDYARQTLSQTLEITMANQVISPLKYQFLM